MGRRRKGGGEFVAADFNVVSISKTNQTSCVPDLLKEKEMTAKTRQKHHNPRNSVNLKNAGGLRRSFLVVFYLLL